MPSKRSGHLSQIEEGQGGVSITFLKDIYTDDYLKKQTFLPDKSTLCYT
ncbi:hypothetical protein [Zunongwangia sp. H14]